MIEYLTLAALIAVVCAVIADSRNRSPALWALIGFGLGVFGLILVLALPKLDAKEPTPAGSSS